jgi:hypothetical protein
MFNMHGDKHVGLHVLLPNCNQIFEYAHEFQ